VYRGEEKGGTCAPDHNPLTKKSGTRIEDTKTPGTGTVGETQMESLTGSLNLLKLVSGKPREN